MHFQLNRNRKNLTKLILISFDYISKTVGEKFKSSRDLVSYTRRWQRPENSPVVSRFSFYIKSYLS